MKHVLTKLMAVTICLIFSLPGVAQLPEFNYLNGLYVKKGTVIAWKLKSISMDGKPRMHITDLTSTVTKSRLRGITDT